MQKLTLNDARTALRTHFGYDDFRAGQARAISAVLEGRDTVVVLPTGGGKSVCYQVPALLLPGLTVVISPLISLMKDQVDALTARSLPAAFINSTLSGAQVAERLARAQRGELKLLYVAPERFDAGSTAERLAAIGISLLAIDEAHCISEWGHDFRPSYLRVGSVRERLGKPTTIALTATATPEVRKDIAKQLALHEPETIVTGFDRANLHYHVVPTPNEQAKDDSLVALLREHEGLAVVYAATRRAVERISGVLSRARIPALAYHAGLDDAHRHEVQDAFMRDDLRAIVATNAFGMGIDKPNVRLVVHHAMPGTLEAYYQEAGRAGRDGLRSTCVLLHSFPDRFTHEFFIKGANPERPLVEKVYASLLARADSSGMIAADAASIAAGLPGKVSDREVDSVLRLLVRGGALVDERGDADRFFVRLLATPERIKREFPDSASLELGLLRALWRAAEKRLYDGASIAVGGLPPGLGGIGQVVPLLDALQDRQFLTWERTGEGLRLVDRRRPLSAFAIDWAMLERRRRMELAKLDAVQKYAYTSGCRRAFVLRYFGDDAARERCAGCDNCLGVTRKATPRAAERSRTRGRSTPTARRDAPAAERGRRPRVDPAELVVETRDAPLYEALRILRRDIAREEQVPPYVVFGDRTLAELSVRRPRNKVALGDVYGVGPTRLERYGERLLDVIRKAPEPATG